MASRARITAHRSYEDFQPASNLVQEEDCETLIVDLPGFRKEQIRVQMDDRSGTVMTSGERPLGNNKWSRFRKDLRLPVNCNTNEIQAKFENGVLRIVMPIKSDYQKQEQFVPKTDQTQLTQKPKPIPTPTPPPPPPTQKPTLLPPQSQKQYTEPKPIPPPLSPPSQKAFTEPKPTPPIPSLRPVTETKPPQSQQHPITESKPTLLPPQSQKQYTEPKPIPPPPSPPSQKAFTEPKPTPPIPSLRPVTETKPPQSQQHPINEKLKPTPAPLHPLSPRALTESKPQAPLSRRPEIEPIPQVPLSQKQTAESSYAPKPKSTFRQKFGGKPIYDDDDDEDDIRYEKQIDLKTGKPENDAQEAAEKKKWFGGVEDVGKHRASTSEKQEKGKEIKENKDEIKKSVKHGVEDHKIATERLTMDSSESTQYIVNMVAAVVVVLALWLYTKWTVRTPW